MESNLIAASAVILGALASLFISALKKSDPNLTGNKTKLMIVMVSLVVAAVYHLLQALNWFPAFVTVLGTASTMYSFFMKK